MWKKLDGERGNDDEEGEKKTTAPMKTAEDGRPMWDGEIPEKEGGEGEGRAPRGKMTTGDGSFAVHLEIERVKREPRPPAARFP